MIKILQGDVLDKLRELPSDSVHCVVTSPPYFGLRSYLKENDPLKPLELGSEKTPAEYIAKMVAVFAEVKRVLHPSGTVWLNIGDSYNGYYANQRATSLSEYAQEARQKVESGAGLRCFGLKPKDLIGVPWMLAFALRDDGWYLRQQIPWVKRNSMPESTEDRPTTSCETIFLLSKSERYFYDCEAVKLPGSMALEKQVKEGYNGKATKDFSTNGAQNASAVKSRIIDNIRKRDKQRGHSRRHAGFNDRWDQMEKEEQGSGWRLTRNSDWFFESIGGLLLNDLGDPLALVVNPAAFREAHFATFPEALVKPCILAGTSAKGCCPKCLAPWERMVEKSGGEPNTEYGTRRKEECAEQQTGGSDSCRLANHQMQTKTIGWQPTCKHGLEPIPCTVLDPFAGSGTSLAVALELGRNAIGIELNPEYIKLIEQRTNVTPGLQLA